MYGCKPVVSGCGKRVQKGVRVRARARARARVRG